MEKRQAIAAWMGIIGGVVGFKELCHALALPNTISIRCYWRAFQSHILFFIHVNTSVKIRVNSIQDQK